MFKKKFVVILNFQMLITKHRLYNEKYDTVVKTPPVLHVQVWDNDTFSPDDFLGATSLSLSWLPVPPQSADKCDLRKAKRHTNLFNSKLARGWFPVVDKPNESAKVQQTGKVEMEIEILTAVEAKANPAGQGRNAPLKLQNPQ
jgi:C2 domain